jgi:ABC-type antimicrobial peptide transport system permease subunit
MVQMKSPEFYGKYDVLRKALKDVGAIQEMSESSSPLSGVWSNSNNFDWPGKDPDLSEDFGTIFITPEYGSTIGWTIKEGRNVSRDFASDSSALIINEAAAKYMGVKDPVGMEVTWGTDKLRIIGVVSDMIVESPYTPVRQAFYLLSFDNVNWINLKLNPDKSAHESIAAIESTFKKILPTVPFDYKFADTEYASKFDAEERIGKLAGVFAILAIIISCLGLFGLASFVAEQRTKEIGIRKVLGASVTQLWKMLSSEFVILVVVSCLVASPIAYYFLSGWLDEYEYHTKITWWIFAAAGAGALVVTLLTVSFQSIKAALMNPVKSLRSE